MIIVQEMVYYLVTIGCNALCFNSVRFIDLRRCVIDWFLSFYINSAFCDLKRCFNSFVAATVGKIWILNVQNIAYFGGNQIYKSCCGNYSPKHEVVLDHNCRNRSARTINEGIFENIRNLRFNLLLFSFLLAVVSTTMVQHLVAGKLLLKGDIEKNLGPLFSYHKIFLFERTERDNKITQLKAPTNYKYEWYKWHQRPPGSRIRTQTY